MADKTEDSIRLVILETYLKAPPNTEYARGYFACLMDEAATDLDDAASDVFENCLALVKDENHRAALIRQRAVTLR